MISAWASCFLCVCWGLCRPPCLDRDGSAERALTKSAWPCWSSSLGGPPWGTPPSSRAPGCGPGLLSQPLPTGHSCGGPERRRAPDTDSQTSLRWSVPLRKKEREWKRGWVIQTQMEFDNLLSYQHRLALDNWINWVGLNRARRGRRKGEIKAKRLLFVWVFLFGGVWTGLN